jgi:hypothetical protein
MAISLMASIWNSRNDWCHDDHGFDPKTIEALALRDAIMAAKNQGFQSILAETYCSELVQFWLERGSHRASIAPLISEISDLSRCFRSFELVFARRSANNVAHECARFACAHGVSMKWLVDVKLHALANATKSPN